MVSRLQLAVQVEVGREFTVTPGATFSLFGAGVSHSNFIVAFGLSDSQFVRLKSCDVRFDFRVCLLLMLLFQFLISHFILKVPPLLSLLSSHPALRRLLLLLVPPPV